MGLGHIAQAAVLPAFDNARESAELVALVSDDPRKRAILSRRYGVKLTHGYDEYEECLRSGEIDAVYLAVPNDQHCAFALRAARAGVHVLCEKPLALTSRDCRAMIDACSKAGVKLMTAYRLHYEKATLEALRLARSGELGQLRFFASTFSMQVVEHNIRLEKERGGGSLQDLGVYCINAARNAFGAEPEEVRATHATGDDPRFREVPEMTAAILRFPGDRLATFTCSFGAADTSVYEIVGTEGALKVEPAFEYAEGLEQRLTLNGKVRRQRYPKRDQFAPELIDFSRCILHGREPEPSGQEGLADVRVIEAIERSASTGRPVRLEPFHRSRRPSPRQEIRRPAVRKPALVHAAPAHQE